MSLTKYAWTVYMNGELFDVMTNEEVEEIVGAWKVLRIDTEHGVIEFA